MKNYKENSMISILISENRETIRFRLGNKIILLKMNKNNINSFYSAAFTAGALLYQEMNSVLHLLMQPNGEKLMKDEIKKNEFLNVASINTRKRYVPELIRM